MKKLLFLLTVILGIALMSSCRKECDFPTPNNPNNPNNPNTTTVKLFYSTGAKGEKGEITSGQTIYTDSLYSTLIYLVPTEGDTIAIGNFSINQGALGILQANQVNGIPYKFLHGVYTLNVTNITFGGASYNSVTNVTVISGNQAPPPPNNEATFPIRLYDLNVGTDNVTVKVRANISQWGNISSTLFGYVRRIDANGWTTGDVTKINDSLMFQLSFPKTNGSYIEFNVRYMPQNNWLTASYGNPPSILYNGTGIPYFDSHSWFGFKLIQNGNNWELRTHNNTLLLTNATTTGSIPGNYEDDTSHNYQVRWAGNKIYFKTTSSTTTVRYKINNGSWIYGIAFNADINSEYKYGIQNIPTSNTTQTVTTQWGTGNNDSNFIPTTNEISNSKFANPTPTGQGVSIVVYQ